MIRSLLKKIGLSGGALDLTGLVVDRPIYAVGDIHGRADLLDRMVTLIGEDVTRRGEPVPTVVFLGDYVDRGVQTREVLQRLRGLAEETGWQVICLRGNHEVMLQGFLTDPEGAAPRWFRNGGLETLLSFEVGGVGPSSTGATLVDARDRLAERMGTLTGWLDRLLPWFRDGDTFFAHAGVDPARPTGDQSERVLYWGVPSFLETPCTDGSWVVHGHYITEEPVLAAGRIGVDTGAYYSGRLTAARIATGSVEFLST